MIDSSGMKDVPLLDLERFHAGESERRSFLVALRTAARDVGFFYLTGHRIEPRLQQELLDTAKRFFALPEAKKLAIDMVNSPHFRGYTRIASEITRGRADWREQIDIGAERPPLDRDPDSPPWTRLQGPNQWPAALPELRPLVLRWQAAAYQVLVRLLHAFVMALGQPVGALEPIYGDNPHTVVKLIRYPGRRPEESAQGVGAHKDSELLTLLLQDSQPGLQVETTEGWTNVMPRAGTVVVNIGEALELASDGYLRATLHRVVSPPVGQERLSAAFFLGPRLDARVPLLQLPPELAAQARGPERDPNNPLFREVGQNYLKGRLRSHPDVARRHYADIIGASNTAPAEPSVPPSMGL